MSTAVLALVSALFGSFVALLGTLLGYSISRRNLELKRHQELEGKLEFEKTHQLSIKTERRFQVEGAIQLIGLLSTESGKEVTTLQKGAIVHLLCELGMFSVAISLTDQMLSTSTIDPGVACWAIDKVINSEFSDYDARYTSMVMLRSHVSDLFRTDGGAEFPDSVCDKDFVANQPKPIREIGTWALIDLMLQRPFKEWRQDSFLFFFDTIYFIFSNDKDETIKRNAGIALNAFIKAFDDPDQIIDLKAGRG